MKLNIASRITCVRIAAVPLLIFLAWRGHERAFVIALSCAFVSDIVDGQIARRCNLMTSLGATLDSWADFLTTLTLPFALYWLRPELIPQVWMAFVVAIVSYFLPIAIGFAKFRRLTSYHTFMARMAAYAIGAGIVLLFARGPILPFQLAVGILALAAVEEIAITVKLDAPRSNVGSLRRVLRPVEIPKSAAQPSQ